MYGCTLAPCSRAVACTCTGLMRSRLNLSNCLTVLCGSDLSEICTVVGSRYSTVLLHGVSHIERPDETVK